MFTTVGPTPSAEAQARCARMIAAYRRMLADLFPTDEVVERRREADNEGDPDAGLCRRGCGYPAQDNGECWSCASGRRL